MMRASHWLRNLISLMESTRGSSLTPVQVCSAPIRYVNTRVSWTMRIASSTSGSQTLTLPSSQRAHSWTSVTSLKIMEPRKCSYFSIRSTRKRSSTRACSRLLTLANSGQRKSNYSSWKRIASLQSNCLRRQPSTSLTSERESGWPTHSMRCNHDLNEASWQTYWRIFTSKGDIEKTSNERDVINYCKDPSDLSQGKLIPLLGISLEGWELFTTGWKRVSWWTGQCLFSSCLSVLASEWRTLETLHVGIRIWD